VSLVDISNRQLVDGAKPAFSPTAETNGFLLRRLLGAQVGLDFGAPTPWSAFEYVRVMEQPIEERSDGGGPNAGPKYLSRSAVESFSV